MWELNSILNSSTITNAEKGTSLGEEASNNNPSLFCAAFSIHEVLTMLALSQKFSIQSPLLVINVSFFQNHFIKANNTHMQASMLLTNKVFHYGYIFSIIKTNS